MEESILKDLVAGNLYQWVDTNQVFKLLEFERAGSWASGEGRGALVSTGRLRGLVFGAGGGEDKFTHVECWKIMIGDKIEFAWLWKGSYRMLE